MLMEARLRDPGLVQNDESGMRCLHACVQMAFRAATGLAIPTFERLAQVLNAPEGKYAWSYPLLTFMKKEGFEVKMVEMFDVVQFTERPEKYLIEFLGTEVGEDQIKNSALDRVVEDAKTMIDSGVQIELREPTKKDVVNFIADGYYVIPPVNQRVLQADQGYVGHAIFVFGVSERGIRFHNPGPPSTADSEIAWSLFEKAWAFPDAKAKNLFAVKPPG